MNREAWWAMDSWDHKRVRHDSATKNQVIFFLSRACRKKLHLFASLFLEIHNYLFSSKSYMPKAALGRYKDSKA